MPGPDDVFGLLLLTVLSVPGLVASRMSRPTWRWERRGVRAAGWAAGLSLVLGIGISLHMCRRGQPYVPCLWIAASCLAWVPAFRQGWRRRVVATLLVVSSIAAGAAYSSLVHADNLVGDARGLPPDRRNDAHWTWHTLITGVHRVARTRPRP